jgi:uncharacterized membrane protein
MRSSVIAIILLVCLAASALAFPGPASGEDVEGSDGGTRAQPTVTIRLDQATKTAKVEPGESGLVIFTGTVECQSVGPGSNVQYTEVVLTTSSENGWATTISPSDMVFTSQGGSSAFTMSVRVPPATSYTVTDTVIIGGTAKQIPGALTYDIPDTRATVLIEQYYRFSTSTTGPWKNDESGRGAVFHINIENEGNGQDRFMLQILNEEPLEDDGLSTQLSTASIDIGEKENETVDLYVNTMSDDVSGFFQVEVEVSSYGSEAVAGLPLYEELELDVRVENGVIESSEETDPPPVDDLEVSAVSRLDSAVAYGEITASQDADVQVDGDVDVTVEGSSEDATGVEVELTATSLQGWEAWVFPSSLDFGMEGGSEGFILTVRVPAGTGSDDVDVVTVGGTYQVSPGGELEYLPETDLEVRVEQYYGLSLDSSSPSPTLEPTEDANYTVDVTNEGNGLDSFSLDIANSDDLTKQDISVQLSSSSLVVDDGDTQDFLVRVEPGEGTRAGEYFITVVAASDGAYGSGGPPVDESIILSLTVEEAEPDDDGDGGDGGDDGGGGGGGSSSDGGDDDGGDDGGGDSDDDGGNGGGDGDNGGSDGDVTADEPADEEGYIPDTDGSESTPGFGALPLLISLLALALLVWAGKRR